MNKLKSFMQQRRRPLLWTGGLLSLYALLGFLLLPWLAEGQLVNTLQQRLGASARVESIHFNPFTLTASVELLQIDAADSSPLMSLGRLYLNLDPSRLLLLKVSIAEITVDTLQLHYTRYSAADDTITRLARQWAATAEPVSTEASVVQPVSEAESATGDNEANDELFPLEIRRIQYLNGSIEYRDEVPQTDFATTLGPVNLDVANISTLDTAEKGSEHLVMQIEQDATLTWDSNFDILPLQFAGHLALDNFSLTTPYRYFQDNLPFVLRDGRVAAEFDYLFVLDDTGPHLKIHNLGVQISALDAVQNGSDAAFLTGGTSVLENANFVYPELRGQAAALRIDNVNLVVLRDAQGVLNLQAMLAGLGRKETPADAAGAPLQLSLGEFVLANTTVNFTDQTTQTPAAFTVQAQARLQNFTLAPETALPFDASLMPNSGGKLNMTGALQLFPMLDLDATLNLADLSLLQLQPYLDQFAQVTLESGVLGLTAQLRSNNSEALALQGDITLNNLQLVDQQRAETLLSVEALRVDNIDFALDSRRLDISELLIDAPYGRVLIDENSITNIGQAFTPAYAAAVGKSVAQVADVDNAADAPALLEETTDNAVTPFAITLGRMQISGASSDFTDRSLPIVFDTKMVALNGEISSFSSNSGQAMTISLEGQVDEFGLVDITGAMNPMDIKQQTKIELAFTNLKLPAMTPYIIKFAGREIAEGNVDVALAFTINDSQLQASNSVTIKDMRLGARVDYPKAMDLPLDLAVALLKNSEGIIALEVPITGNLNDPEFDFGPVIRQAIFNVIVNIVTSPFRLLGNLIGGDAEAIDSIRFRPGHSDLAPPEQEKLQQLLMALGQRPQLALVVPAPLAADEDTAALQISAVEARIEAQLAQDNSDAQLPERRLAILESLYTSRMLVPALEELRVPFTPAPASDAEEEGEPVFDALAYGANLRERLIAAEPVTEQMLQDLAMARQGAVLAYLLASGKITAERLQNQDIDTAAMEDGWLNAEFNVGVIE